MRKLLSLRHAGLIFALLCSCFAINPGCAWYAPAAADRLFEPAPVVTSDTSHWPDRATSRLEQIIQMGPDVLSLRVKHDVLVDGQLIQDPKKLPPTEMRYSGIYGRGIIRTYRPDPDRPDAGRVMSQGMCFFSGVEATSGAKRKWAAVGVDEPTVQQTSSGAPAKPAKWVVNLRGTWMRLDQPLDGQRARGLIVHLTSFGGYEYEKPILNEMRARGWAVLWVDSSTVKPETTYIDVDARYLGSAAQRIAQNISDRVSEIAYAVEGGLEFIEKEHPEIPHSPTIIMGYSAGALATPTVVSLMPDRFDAAVLVGGGANLLDISQRSALTDGGLKLRWTRTPTAADKEQLEQLYLENCRLDPYWTAQYLRDKPVLLLHAVLDRIVPASDGDLLYNQLGRPERVNFLLGHELLFLRLGSQTRKIADWVDNVADTSAIASRR